MGSLFSKSSKTQKSKDPKWQGIGPNTPLPAGGGNTSNNNRYGAGVGGGGPSSQGQQQQLRSQTPALSNNNKSTKNNKNSVDKSPKIKLLLKMDPKSGGKGHRKVIITKAQIGLPSEFRHTGHIGAGEVRSGQIDPEKIKNQMMEVAACLKMDMNAPIPMLKTIPIQPENQAPSGLNRPELDRYEVRPGAVAAH
ncbi:hypothetical protein BGZ83_005357 [Gryganskiella cystojenkinii]|nr:hypothetical protein BGZ83_005357 [Gryganskiella cystojenkinii]